MNMVQRRTIPLIDRLPKVRGRLSENAPLSGITWFRVGGPAEIMFRPADREDLIQFIAGLPREVPLTVIGVGSNLLVRDGGVSGVVLRLGKGFAEIETGQGQVHAGAAALDINIARVAGKAGLAALEFLSGIPGTLGGALRMNAGAYGRELVDVVHSAEAIDRDGRLHYLNKQALGLSYRHCDVPDDWIFLGADLSAKAGDPVDIQAMLADIQAKREASQPIRARTGGSTFANPPGAKAWELIERAGCRGMRMGGAMVSEMHTNFLINTGSATAADIEGLGEEVRRRVRDTSGIELTWEIRRIGEEAAR